MAGGSGGGGGASGGGSSASTHAPPHEDGRDSKQRWRSSASNGNEPRLVRNELLTFATQKMNYMPADSIIQLCIQFYDDEALEAASMLLHELCADRADPSQRYKRRKGDGKKKSTMKDIISLLERRSDVLEETFAAVDLANLPPVSFDSLDVCALLSRVEATKGEMEMMKTSFNLMTDTLAAQASVCDDLRKAMQGLVDSRVDTRPTTTETVTQTAEWPTLATNHATEVLPVCPPGGADDSEASEVSVSNEEMALFTEVLRKGKKKLKTVSRPTTSIAPRVDAASRGKKRATSAITGRGIGIGIGAAKRIGRFANIFATRLAPELTDTDLKGYLDSALGLVTTVECVKATDWHTSFHITCSCDDPKVFLNGGIWPEGAYVRWWGDKRRDSGRSTGGGIVQGGVSTGVKPLLSKE